MFLDTGIFYHFMLLSAFKENNFCLASQVGCCFILCQIINEKLVTECGPLSSIDHFIHKHWTFFKTTYFKTLKLEIFVLHGWDATKMVLQIIPKRMKQSIAAFLALGNIEICKNFVFLLFSIPYFRLWKPGYLIKI